MFCVCLLPQGTPAAAAKEGDIPADVVLSLLEMSDAMHKGSYSLQVKKKTSAN